MNKLVVMIFTLVALNIPFAGCTMESSNMESPRMTFHDDVKTIPANSGWSFQQISGYSNFEWRTNISSGDNPEWSVHWMEKSECGNWMIGEAYEIIDELSMANITSDASKKSIEGLINSDGEYCLAIENLNSEDIELTVLIEAW